MSRALLCDPDSPACVEDDDDDPPVGEVYLCDWCHRLRDDVRERENRRNGLLVYVCDDCASDTNEIDRLIDER